MSGHAVAAQHQRLRFCVREGIEIGAQPRQAALHVLRNPVCGDLSRVGIRRRRGCLEGPAPIHVGAVEILLQVDEEKLAHASSAMRRVEPAISRAAHGRLQDRVRAAQDRCAEASRMVDGLALAARVAHQNHVAFLLEQAVDALVVLNAAVDEPHGLVRIEAAHRDRREDPRHAGRGSDRATEADLRMRHRRLAIEVHAPEAVVRVDFALDRDRRLAHEARGELPIVARVKAGRVQDQDRHLRIALPVLVLRIEVGFLADGVHEEVLEPARSRQLRVRRRVDLLLEELSDRARSLHQRKAPRLLPHHAVADVGSDARHEGTDRALDDGDVHVAIEVRVQSRLELPLELQVVVRADDRTPRNAREHLDVSEHVQLRQSREHAEVEERGAKPSA